MRAALHGRSAHCTVARAGSARRAARADLVVLRSNAEHKIVLVLASTSLALEASIAARALVEEILLKSDVGIERMWSWNVLTRVCTGCSALCGPQQCFSKHKDLHQQK